MKVLKRGYVRLMLLVAGVPKCYTCTLRGGASTAGKKHFYSVAAWMDNGCKHWIGKFDVQLKPENEVRDRSEVKRPEQWCFEPEVS